MVVARGVNIETMGVMAELPPDLSPFQIGTRGEWNGTGFQIVGRIRVSYAEGRWNEWCLLCGDGHTIGWLAEAQGLLMISFAADLSGAKLPKADDCQPGHTFQLAGSHWAVTDVKSATCLAGEGELPFMATPASARLGVDLVATDGKFGSLEFDEDGTRLYVGDFAEFSGLRCQALRPVPGWSADAPLEKNRTGALACVQCGAAVNLRAAGLSMSAVCGSCGTVIDTSNPQLTTIQGASEKVKHLRPLIPIGTRGNLRGVDWEIIGMCVRKDQWSSWSEYLLFNPWCGFRWLVTFNGHWSFVDRVNGIGNLSGDTITVNGRDYRIFGSSASQITGVLGEFYWKVQRGERTFLSDYIAPPFILSKEFHPDLKEFTWSHGEYMDSAEVAAAFRLKDPPTPSGIYLNQPNPAGEKWRTVKWRWLPAALAVIGIQILFAMGSGGREIASAQLAFDRDALSAAAASLEKPAGEAPASTQLNVQVTPHFQLNGRASRVDIEAEAPVDNNWVGASVELVNAKTSEHFPAEIQVGYYHGYDDGEWSEGARKTSVSIPAVPPGEYFMTVETSADSGIRKMPIAVRVKHGGLFWSNFILMLGLVSIYPVTLLVRRNMFERARWRESDCSPCAASSDDSSSSDDE